MEHRKSRIKVLFLCTANSCRSQMAEALANHRKGDLIAAFSAGTAPVAIHPLTLHVLREAGVDASSLRSKHVSELGKENFDYVVTLCGSARESCPVFPRPTKVIHVGFEDPAAAGGSDDARLQVFRRTRDGIDEFVRGLPWELEHYQEDE